MSKPEYNLEEWGGRLRGIFFEAKAEGKKTIELPTSLVGFISSWLIQYYNLKGEYEYCLKTREEFFALMQDCQDIANDESIERNDAKNREIVNRLGISKQRSLDAKGREFDDYQLFKEYARTVLAWKSSEDYKAKREQVLESIRSRYNILTREAIIGRLKRGKKLAKDAGEDISEYAGVLPNEWPDKY